MLQLHISKLAQRSLLQAMKNGSHQQIVSQSHQKLVSQAFPLSIPLDLLIGQITVMHRSHYLHMLDSYHMDEARRDY